MSLAGTSELERKTPASRECGDCSLCCKLVAVHAIQKPAGAWCRHCRAGTPTPCTIYEKRPSECREFECGWLSGAIPEDLRPNRTHVVFAGSLDNRALVIFVDPSYPDAWREKRVGAFLGRLNMPAILVIGHRRLVAVPASAREALAFRDPATGRQMRVNPGEIVEIGFDPQQELAANRARNASAIEVSRTLGILHQE